MNKNWSNTALVAYSLLPKIVGKLDFAIESRVNSSFQSKHLRQGISTERLIDEILELTDEKRKIVNLSFIVATALDRIAVKHKKILHDRIELKMTYQQLAADMHISLRTAFRRVADAEDAFAAEIHMMGYTEEWFENEYGNDKYISLVYSESQKYRTAKNI